MGVTRASKNVGKSCTSERACFLLKSFNIFESRLSSHVQAKHLVSERIQTGGEIPYFNFPELLTLYTLWWELILIMEHNASWSIQSQAVVDMSLRATFTLHPTPSRPVRSIELQLFRDEGTQIRLPMLWIAKFGGLGVQMKGGWRRDFLAYPSNETSNFDIYREMEHTRMVRVWGVSFIKSIGVCLYKIRAYMVLKLCDDIT